MTFKDYATRTFYEIYPLTFKDANGDGFGDLQGIISKLDYVASLGFTGIWVNPFYKSAWLDGGYDITDPKSVDPRCGTLEDAKALIEAAHAKGIAVFFDLVPGHLSWNSPEFQESAKATPNAYSDLFIWTDKGGWETDPNLTFNVVLGLYPRDGSFYVNFFVHQPALNYGFNRIDHPSWQEPITGKGPKKARAYLESVIAFWLDLGVDGFRVDMADSLVKNDDSKEKTMATWKRIRKDLEPKYGAIPMVSEWSTPSRSLNCGFASDFVLDHNDNFSYYFFRAGTEIWDANPTWKPLFAHYDEARYQTAVTEMMAEIHAAEKSHGWLSPISGNHDTSRLADSLKGNDLKNAYVFLFTLPGVPFVFAGDEAMQTTLRGYPSKEGGYQRTGTRLSMKWDDSNPLHGFSSAEASKAYLPNNPTDPTVEASQKDPASLLNLIKALNALRKSDPDLLRHDGFKLLSDPLSYRRGKTTVIINLKETPIVKPMAGKILLSVGDVSYDGKTLLVPPHCSVVFKGK